MLHKFLMKKIKDEKIILFGEIHGTKEIPNMLNKFFSMYSKNNNFNLGLEIQENNQIHIDNFLKKGEEKYLLKMPFFKYRKQSDGRNSLEYLNLIKKIYYLNIKFKKEIKIFCIDTSNHEDYKIPNKRETKIAENIIKIISEEKTFVILGAIHASKRIIKFEKMKLIPAGLIIYDKYKNDVMSIFFNVKSGLYFNQHLKEIKKEADLEMLNHYDYIFTIDRVTPANFLNF